MPLDEYRQGAAFPGVLGRTYDTSTQAWPEPRRAREGLPNVLFIILDDTGYGQLGCYGSPIRTPRVEGGAVLPRTYQLEARQPLSGGGPFRVFPGAKEMG